MFQRLPRKRKSQQIEAPATQASKVDICAPILNVQRSPNEGFSAILCGFPKVFQQM
jgi:hypothetical protein